MCFKNQNEVQVFLDSVLEGELIKVRFFKKDGSVAEYEGVLDVGAARKESVAIYTSEGWKRFNINHVTNITKAGE